VTKVEQLIFVDETGSHIDMARVYARIPRRHRAYAAKLGNRGHALTMSGAMGWHGFVPVQHRTGGDINIPLGEQPHDLSG
jgi:hypothetical protein